MAEQKKSFELGVWFREMRETPIGSFIPVLCAMFLIWGYFGLSEPAFFSPRNLYYLFMQSAVVGAVAVGITAVLLLGDIDLSVAAVAGVAAAVLAVLLKLGYPAPVAVLAALATGIFLSTCMGLLVSLVGIPSFVVTLAGLLGFQGLMQKVLGQSGAINVGNEYIRGLSLFALPPLWGWVLAIAAVAIFALSTIMTQRKRNQMNLEKDSTLLVIGQLAFFSTLVFVTVGTLNAYKGIPLLVLVLFIITAILGWLTTSTPFGRSLFALGGNQESARRVGMPVKRIRIAAFAIVGFMAAVAGILGASRYGSVSYTAFAGGSLLLEGIGAAVIGGTSLFGGRGSVWNAILGALVIGSLGNGLDLGGASAADKLMISGVILILAVTIDALSRPNTGTR